MASNYELEINKSYTVQEIEGIFNTSFGHSPKGINLRRDMGDNQYIILFSSAEGPYSDTFDGSYFYYSGEGQEGDQKLTPANKALTEAIGSEKDIFGFRKPKDSDGWEYIGELAVVDYEYVQREGRKIFEFKILQKSKDQDADPLNTYTIDKARFENEYLRFLNFVLSTTGDSEFQSFSSNATTEEQEGYKYDIYDEARKALEHKRWKEDMIGTGEIHKYTLNALLTKEVNNNLVDWRLVDRYREGVLFNNDFKSLERVLYDLYKNKSDDRVCFEALIDILGANYSLIAYLFFIKDRRMYMPISTTKFDDAFSRLGISDFKTTKYCSWDNYQKYNLIIEETKLLLSQKVPGEVTLLDAHSFLWIISRDIEKEIEEETYVTTQEKPITLRDAPRVSGIRREVVQRQGQDLFRKKLMIKWSGKCSVTGFDIEGTLTAAHIKPWAVSSNEEKFDEYNGLLLSPDLDRLFDIGLISFDESGKIMLSSELDAHDISKLGLNKDMKIRKPFEDEHLKYLTYHHEQVFIN